MRRYLVTAFDPQTWFNIHIYYWQVGNTLWLIVTFFSLCLLKSQVVTHLFWFRVCWLVALVMELHVKTKTTFTVLNCKVHTVVNSFTNSDFREFSISFLYFEISTQATLVHFDRKRKQNYVLWRPNASWSGNCIVVRVGSFSLPKTSLSEAEMSLHSFNAPIWELKAKADHLQLMTETSQSMPCPFHSPPWVQ